MNVGDLVKIKKHTSAYRILGDAVGYVTSIRKGYGTRVAYVEWMSTKMACENVKAVFMDELEKV